MSTEHDDLIFNVGDVVSGYKIVEKIDEGGFGQVFKVSKDEKIYAMKIESNAQEGGSAIKLEIDVLMDLKAKKVNNFPMVYQAGKKPKYHFLVMELLGDNLKCLRFKSTNPFTLSDGTWTRIGIQCLYVIKLLHDNGFVHRDIKPSNFAMGYNDEVMKSRMVYLFDFGLARRFVLKNKNTSIETSKRNNRTVPDFDREKFSMRDKKGDKKNQQTDKRNTSKKVIHSNRKPLEQSRYEPESIVNEQQYRFRIARPHTDFRGTQQYASPNAHAQIELGRADDVWSLMYMLAEMLNPLPWALKENEEIPIEDLKSHTSLQTLFKIPSFSKVDDNLKACNYYTAPDYELIYSVIKNLMDKSGVAWNDPYDWETAQMPSYVKWKEEKLKQRIMYKWEEPEDYFKKDPWDALVKPVKKPKIDDKQSRKERKKSDLRKNKSKEDDKKIQTANAKDEVDISRKTIDMAGTPTNNNANHATTSVAATTAPIVLVNGKKDTNNNVNNKGPQSTRGALGTEKSVIQAANSVFEAVDDKKGKGKPTQSAREKKGNLGRVFKTLVVKKKPSGFVSSPPKK